MDLLSKTIHFLGNLQIYQAKPYTFKEIIGFSTRPEPAEEFSMIFGSKNMNGGFAGAPRPASGAPKSPEISRTRPGQRRGWHGRARSLPEFAGPGKSIENRGM